MSVTGTGGGNKLEQYDAAPRDLRNIEERRKLRTEFRKEFIKQFTNPHRHGEGGYLFDPQLQRWQSMRAQHWYYFKPTPKTLWVPAIAVFLCAAYGHLLAVRHEKREKSYRQGLVSYKDREWKFI